MTPFLRTAALVSVLTAPVLAGCASSGCEFLAYDEGVPQEAPTLVMPDGIPAPAERGEFRIPPVDAAPASGQCIAEPPVTLPIEKRQAPGGEEEEPAVEEA